MIVRPLPLSRRAFQKSHHLVELLLRQQPHGLFQFRHLLVARFPQQQRPPPPRQAYHLLGAEQLVDVPTEVPQHAQLRQVLEHPHQVVPLPACQVLRPLDDQVAVLVHECRLLLVGRPAPPRPPLLLLALSSPPPLRVVLLRLWASRPPRGPRVAPPRLDAPQAADGGQYLVVDVLQYVEDTQLVPRLGPDFGQDRRVEVGAVGHHHLRLEAPVLQRPQEAAQGRLIVDLHQAVANDAVGDRVRGQQQGVLAQVHLIDAQGTAEALPGQATLPGVVELAQPPVQAVVDEATGQLQPEIALHAGAGTLDVETVVENAVEDGLADEVVVLRLGTDMRRAGAKRLAAVAAGRVVGVREVEPERRPVADGAAVAVQAAFAVSAAAAGRAGIGLGPATDSNHLLPWLGFEAHGLRS